MNDFTRKKLSLTETLRIISYFANKSMIHQKMDTVQLEQIGQGIQIERKSWP